MLAGPDKIPPNDTATTLTIESRDLDTDARERTTVEVTAPFDAGRQRSALAAAVGELYPRARLRSFSDGTATFLDSQHLIVASYRRLPRRSGRRAGGMADEQQKPLFAA